MKVKFLFKVGFIFIICICLISCSANGKDEESYPSKYPDSLAQTREEVLFPQYPQTSVLSDGSVAMIDYSNASEGYIGAKLLKESDAKVNIQVMKDEVKYNYEINSLEYISLPLQMENGIYKFKIMQNVEGDSYAILASVDVDVNMPNDKSVYLYPNQVVDYQAQSQVVDLSFALVKKDTNDLERIKTLYEYVVEHLDYDDDKAKNVVGKYVLPNLDNAIDSGKGICFDYASLLAALCRIQGIPAKVITGETTIEYHAWVEIWLEGKGWINPKIEFDKDKWTLVDPTFDDSTGEYDGPYEEYKRY
ncbi:MAG: transglutaminase domain-containing protein [Erysipelotrichia bacterium]|nr:transglutaminase domain-containing protein [Erysipelotrichia bacterium]NCC54430.1 transglutaminase domain-containing protein [Erysipelotrichia bacterium]